MNILNLVSGQILIYNWMHIMILSNLLIYQFIMKLIQNHCQVYKSNDMKGLDCKTVVVSE